MIIDSEEPETRVRFVHVKDESRKVLCASGSKVAALNVEKSAACPISVMFVLQCISHVDTKLIVDVFCAKSQREARNMRVISSTISVPKFVTLALSDEPRLRRGEDSACTDKIRLTFELDDSSKVISVSCFVAFVVLIEHAATNKHHDVIDYPMAQDELRVLQSELRATGCYCARAL